MLSSWAKMWFAIVGALVAFVGFVVLGNQALYVAWRTAFEGAQIEQLRIWFYIYSAGATLMVAVTIWLAWTAWRFGMQTKTTAKR